MTYNRDIQMLQVFSFEIRTKLKCSPFNNEVKEIMLDCLQKIHLPIYKYGRVANNIAFDDFRKKLARKVVNELETRNFNPNLIKRCETYLTKITR